MKNKLLTWATVLLMPFGMSSQTLVWEDNFDTTHINPTHWTYDLGDGCDRNLCGWGNSELQYYTNRPENARIENGNLVIEAHREDFKGKSFTSARLKTAGRMHFKYGTVEARIKLPNVTNGLWPAFWTLGTVGGTWPSIGEIDMMEVGAKNAIKAGVANKRVSSASHWSKADGSHDFNVFSTDAAVDLSLDYHLYKMVWTRQHIKMYLDNVEFYSFDISGGAAANVSEFHHPHYLLLDLAVGGAYTGIYNKLNTEGGINAPLPAKMYVDYVKIYQNTGDGLYLTDAIAQNVLKNPSTTSETQAINNTHSTLTTAPLPTHAANKVISLFSNAYKNQTVDTWSASWDQADVKDTLIMGNDTKIYTNMVYSGIEFTSKLIDATAMTHFHIDIWTPKATTFKVKLVDFGANGIYQGTPNDDTEHELSFTPTSGTWTGYDIPLSNFTDMTARAHLAQMILVGSNSTVYVDNVYFYNGKKGEARRWVKK